MATITHDTLDWYGWDEDGAGCTMSSALDVTPIRTYY